MGHDDMNNLSGEQVDRVYYILMAGMTIAFVFGVACTVAFERMFNLC